MAQKTIKNYFPSKKIQDNGKNATAKRSLESYTVPRSKRRRVEKVLTSQQEDELCSRDEREDIASLSDVPTSLLVRLSSTSSTNSYTTPRTREETPAGVKSCNTSKLNCFETLPPPAAGVSPLRRGAECVRLSLEKKTLSPVKLGKDEAEGVKGKTPLCETRRKLFSSEANDNLKSTTERNRDDEKMTLPAVKEPTAAENNRSGDRISSSPVKQSISGVIPLKKKTPVTTRNVKQTAPKIKPFTSLQYDSPTKADKHSNIPAYEKYKSLTEPSSVATDLPLPKHYGLLAEKFHCTDTIVNMFQRRGEICTFTKLKLAVQQMNGRLFGTSDLAKMKTVYPTALLLAQQTRIPGGYGRDIYNSYQLTVECNVKELAVDDCGVLPIDNPLITTMQPPHLASSVLLRRRQKFKRNLVTIVKRHHKEFLANLDPPLSIMDDEIVRWHPAFVLERVAEVEEAPLPQAPSSHTCSTAKDVLDMAQSSVMPQRMQQALEDVAAFSEADKSDHQPPETNPTIDKALKGISQSLVDKIKLKESHRAKATMTRNHVTEKKLAMLSALPDMCRIIKNLFLADKKAAMPVEEVTNKLMDSSGTSPDIVEAHLSLMEEVLPQWIKRVTVRKICYIKIDRKMSIKDILELIEKSRDLL